ncbi:MAG: T9SS type A sorting domain-containing protein, partial [Candidatus Cloacimonetes bacterium]|nr:T9SS type A sorting domain-containing protein [Candidatus Cloacimonadota bacterium]
GHYTSPQYVVISCPTFYTQIRYTMNGTEPSQTSSLYTAPINLSTNSNYTIKAKAYRTDWIPSPTVSAHFYITGTVSTPIFDPPAGMYMGEVQVSLICHTSNANIHYTLDGSTPDESSPQYAGPITITEDTTLKAIAFKTDWTTSGVAEGLFEIIPVSNPDDTQAPLFTGIHNVYPNPFADAITIRIGIKEPNPQYQLNIYNLKGQRVHQYVGKAKGFQDYRWDGRDASGKKVPAGIYFLRMQTPTQTSIKKIVRQ